MAFRVGEAVIPAGVRCNKTPPEFKLDATHRSKIQNGRKRT